MPARKLAELKRAAVVRQSKAMHRFCSALSCLGIAFLLSTGALAQQPSTTTKPAPAATSPSASSAQASPFTTDKERQSYAIGMNIGHSMKNDGLDLDPNVVAQGVKDSLTGAKSQMSDEEMKEAMTKLRTEVIAHKQEEMQRAGEANKKAGEQFLAANKSKEGVVTLPSGLEYKILKAGTGPKPVVGDTVVCNYRGSLIDGTEFDSSEKHGEPASLTVGQVIKGWNEALQLMPVGSKWELYIPPDLGYGSTGAGNVIGPDSTLIFDVELLSIKGK